MHYFMKFYEFYVDFINSMSYNHCSWVDIQLGPARCQPLSTDLTVEAPPMLKSSLRSTLAVAACVLMVACGSQDKGSNNNPATPAKPSKPTVASVAPTPAPTVAPVVPVTPAAPVTPPSYPQVGGPVGGHSYQTASVECPNGPVRRFLYNVFHKEDCVQ